VQVLERKELASQAEKILRQNDMGGWTRAAPNLYPHQWSWDNAFIAIGLARIEVRRAASELRTLFAHQWATGKVPHIVFNPDCL
jgi:glucosylglycerate hydrolase